MKKHRKIINELSEITKAFNLICEQLKTKGLSNGTTIECQKIIKPLQTSAHKDVIEVADSFINYLNGSQNKLPCKNSKWHISSDIIESLFGSYKSRKSSNPLNGVTQQVMILPVLTRINAETGMSNINFKQAFEMISLSNLRQWSEDNLTENLTVKRRRALNAA